MVSTVGEVKAEMGLSHFLLNLEGSDKLREENESPYGNDEFT